MRVNLNCRHFPGDRPCIHHKQTGELCGSCRHYAEAGERILIVKLDALGDVLRTTCLLPSLKRRHPESHITWITSKAAVPVLANNPYVDEVLPANAEGLARLQAESFDRVLNPDASKRSAALASLAAGSVKRGFALGRDGQVHPLNREAVEWLEMGARDDLKRTNRATYQDHLHRICGVAPEAQKIVLRLSAEERAFADDFLRLAGVPYGTLRIGFNTGSSSRWPRKRWPREHFLGLAVALQRATDAGVLLLGGPPERETNQWIAAQSAGFAVDCGSDHSLREYFGLLDLCDVVVTGDTLGLHAALGLGKKAVALFGPTSPWEIDLYGRGVRVVPEMECVCCYRSDCAKSPSCMEQIRVETVLAATLRLLGQSPPAEAAVEDEAAQTVG